MTVTDQLKIIDKKIKTNQVQYNVDILTAKIPALSSSKLEKKYKCLTGEDLGYKPSAVEQAKFEYSPLGKVFNRRLEKEDNKEGLLKRRKRKMIRDISDIKSQMDLFDEDLTLEAVALIKETKTMEDNVGYSKLSFMGGKKKVYGYKNFRTLEKLIKDLINRNMTIDKAEIKQNELAEKLDKLRAHAAKGYKYIDLKESVYKNAKKIMTNEKNHFMGLEIEYYHFIKRMIWKLIAAINNRIFQTDLNRQDLMIS